MKDDVTLDQLVCFALASAARAATNRYRPLLDALGITYPQYLVLILLWERDGRTVKDLGGALRLESSTLSPLLKRMETAGLLERRRRSDDERSVTVHLTPAGAGMRERARAIPGTLVCDSGMDLAELDELRAALVRLTERLNVATLDNAEGAEHAGAVHG